MAYYSITYYNKIDTFTSSCLDNFESSKIWAVLVKYIFLILKFCP